MPRNVVSLFTAVLLLAATATLGGQSPSTIDPAALDAAVSAPAPDARATVRATLSTERALKLAATLGLDQHELEARIDALDNAEAERLARRVLAGGDTIVISATTLIIILLILILITD